jgi:hypothetical protein
MRKHRHQNGDSRVPLIGVKAVAVFGIRRNFHRQSTMHRNAAGVGKPRNGRFCRCGYQCAANCKPDKLMEDADDIWFGQSP